MNHYNLNAELTRVPLSNVINVLESSSPKTTPLTIANVKAFIQHNLWSVTSMSIFAVILLIGFIIIILCRSIKNKNESNKKNNLV